LPLYSNKLRLQQLFLHFVKYICAMMFASQLKGESKVNIDELRMALEDRNLLEVSKRAGVSYSALRKIAAGNYNISLRTANRLSSYLFGIKHEARPTH